MGSLYTTCTRTSLSFNVFILSSPIHDDVRGFQDTLLNIAKVLPSAHSSWELFKNFHLSNISRWLKFLLISTLSTTSLRHLDLIARRSKFIVFNSSNSKVQNFLPLLILETLKSLNYELEVKIPKVLLNEKATPVIENSKNFKMATSKSIWLRTRFWKMIRHLLMFWRIT